MAVSISESRMRTPAGGGGHISVPMPLNCRQRPLTHANPAGQLAVVWHPGARVHVMVSGSQNWSMAHMALVVQPMFGSQRPLVQCSLMAQSVSSVHCEPRTQVMFWQY